jgi:hypothetical protein
MRGIQPPCPSTIRRFCKQTLYMRQNHLFTNQNLHYRLLRPLDWAISVSNVVAIVDSLSR